MKTLLSIAVASLFLAGCTARTAAPEATDGELTAADSVYTREASARLIEKSNATPTELTQADYARIIEQCRAINSLMAERLKRFDFSASMTAERMDSLMAVLRADSVMPVLEEQSRTLLVVLQNADLDEANRDRYDSMIADAERALRSL